MLLNNLFIENPINFEKRCKIRIAAGCLLLVLGAAAVTLAVLTRGNIPVLYLEGGHSDFVSGFYTGTGCGLIAAAVITIIKNIRYLKNSVLKKEREIYETDERNRMLCLRSFAYAGYSMLFLLYIAILISGFISMTILQTLLAVLAAFVLILIIFRTILQKIM